MISRRSGERWREIIDEAEAAISSAGTSLLFTRGTTNET